jgi:hypothetical protein
MTDIRLYDFRARRDELMAGVIVNHPSSVIRMRQVEDHLLMVSGFENTVSPELKYIDCSLPCMIYVRSSVMFDQERYIHFL